MDVLGCDNLLQGPRIKEMANRNRSSTGCKLVFKLKRKKKLWGNLDSGLYRAGKLGEQWLNLGLDHVICSAPNITSCPIVSSQ